MKLSVHSGRTGSANHNDRNFDYETYAPHIDPTKVKDNIYIGRDNDNISFRELEFNYYKEHFDEAVKYQNKKNSVTGHAERNRTMKDVYEARRTRPEEIIIQIGNKDDKYTDIKTFEKIIREYIESFNEEYGKNCKILDAAIHTEETNIHAHIRRVWFVETEHGQKVSQSKALEELGYERPDLDKKISRYNNSKITFSKAERRLVINICKENGVKLEKTNHDRSRDSLSINDYKVKKLKEEIKEMESRLQSLKTEEMTKTKQLDLYNRIHEMIQADEPSEIERVISNATSNENEVVELKKENKDLKRTISKYEDVTQSLYEEKRQLETQLEKYKKQKRKMDHMRQEYEYLEDAIARACEDEARRKEEQKEREDELSV